MLNNGLGDPFIVLCAFNSRKNTKGLVKKDMKENTG